MDRLAELLEAGRRRAELSDIPTLVSFTKPLEKTPDPLCVYANARKRGRPAIFWCHPEAAFWFVGIGEALSSRLEGADTLRRASRIREDLLKNAVVEGPGLPGTGPTFMGAFRFDSETPPAAPWDDIPSNVWVLPRILVSHTAGGTWVTLNTLVSRKEDVEDVRFDVSCDELESLDEAPIPQLLDLHDVPKPVWRLSVARILEGIGTGRLAKATLARHVRLAFDRAVPEPTVLRRLLTSYPECRVFAVARGGSSFLGATPELLIEQQQRRFRSVCLAGSAERDADETADIAAGETLMLDRKELWEHEIVVRWIAERLRPVATELHWNERPRLLRLRAVQHLATTFEGSVGDGRDALDLLAAIHPTPAVGGQPLEAALKLQRGEETFDRGWYAGPIGWMDRGGEGEFGLGIRSALVKGRHVHLFAGSGIVEGSDADREWREVELKLTPLLSALGLKEGVVDPGAALRSATKA